MKKIFRKKELQNHYFVETDDHGDNDNFITMSSTDIIDSLGRTKIFHIQPSKEENETPDIKNSKFVPKPKPVKTEPQFNKIIKLKDH